MKSCLFESEEKEEEMKQTLKNIWKNDESLRRQIQNLQSKVTRFLSSQRARSFVPASGERRLIKNDTSFFLNSEPSHILLTSKEGLLSYRYHILQKPGTFHPFLSEADRLFFMDVVSDNIVFELGYDILQFHDIFLPPSEMMENLTNEKKKKSQHEPHHSFFFSEKDYKCLIIQSLLYNLVENGKILHTKLSDFLSFIGNQIFFKIHLQQQQQQKKAQPISKKTPSSSSTTHLRKKKEEEEEEVEGEEDDSELEEEKLEGLSLEEEETIILSTIYEIVSEEKMIEINDLLTHHKLSKFSSSTSKKYNLVLTKSKLKNIFRVDQQKKKKEIKKKKKKSDGENEPLFYHLVIYNFWYITIFSYIRHDLKKINQIFNSASAAKSNNIHHHQNDPLLAEENKIIFLILKILITEKAKPSSMDKVQNNLIFNDIHNECVVLDHYLFSTKSLESLTQSVSSYKSIFKKLKSLKNCIDLKIYASIKEEEEENEDEEDDDPYLYKSLYFVKYLKNILRHKEYINLKEVCDRLNMCISSPTNIYDPLKIQKYLYFNHREQFEFVSKYIIKRKEFNPSKIFQFLREQIGSLSTSAETELKIPIDQLLYFMNKNLKSILPNYKYSKITQSYLIHKLLKKREMMECMSLIKDEEDQENNNNYLILLKKKKKHLIYFETLDLIRILSGRNDDDRSETEFDFFLQNLSEKSATPTNYLSIDEIIRELKRRDDKNIFGNKNIKISKQNILVRLKSDDRVALSPFLCVLDKAELKKKLRKGIGENYYGMNDDLENNDEDEDEEEETVSYSEQVMDFLYSDKEMKKRKKKRQRRQKKKKKSRSKNNNNNKNWMKDNTFRLLLQTLLKIHTEYEQQIQQNLQHHIKNKNIFYNTDENNRIIISFEELKKEAIKLRKYIKCSQFFQFIKQYPFCFSSTRVLSDSEKKKNIQLSSSSSSRIVFEKCFISVCLNPKIYFLNDHEVKRVKSIIKITKKKKVVSYKPVSIGFIYDHIIENKPSLVSDGEEDQEERRKKEENKVIKYFEICGHQNGFLLLKPNILSSTFVTIKQKQNENESSSSSTTSGPKYLSQLNVSVSRIADLILQKPQHEYLNIFECFLSFFDHVMFDVPQYIINFEKENIYIPLSSTSSSSSSKQQKQQKQQGKKGKGKNKGKAGRKKLHFESSEDHKKLQILNTAFDNFRNFVLLNPTYQEHFRLLDPYGSIINPVDYSGGGQSNNRKKKKKKKKKKLFLKKKERIMFASTEKRIQFLLFPFLVDFLKMKESLDRKENPNNTSQRPPEIGIQHLHLIFLRNLVLEKAKMDQSISPNVYQLFVKQNEEFYKNVVMLEKGTKGGKYSFLDHKLQLIRNEIMRTPKHIVERVLENDERFVLKYSVSVERNNN